MHPLNNINQIDIEEEQQLGQDMHENLNNEQRHVYDTVMNAIQTNSHQNCFFLDGPAGTGKTFLYNTIVHNLQALRIKVICVA